MHECIKSIECKFKMGKSLPVLSIGAVFCNFRTGHAMEGSRTDAKWGQVPPSLMHLIFMREIQTSCNWKQ